MSIKPCIVESEEEKVIFSCDEVLEHKKEYGTVYINAKPGGNLAPYLIKLAHTKKQVRIELLGKLVVEKGEIITHGNLCNKKYVSFVIEDLL